MDPLRLRFVADGVLTPEECKELVFIAEACGVVGYRPCVQSCTLHDLLAGSSTAGLILPLLRLRDRVRELVEEQLGLHCELLHEFTGLISWGPGASIGWHFDSNKAYLEQRAVSAVVYLSSKGRDFEGGNFQFRDPEEEADVVPAPGRVVLYTAGEENVHRVGEVVGGRRHTVALWFTKRAKHDEDAALLRALGRLGGAGVGGEPLTLNPEP